MPVAFVLVGLAVVLLVGVLAVGWFGDLPEADPDRTPLNLPPDGALAPRDVKDVRFAVGLRGYRMDEVDTVLERVTMDLAERDGHITFLQQRFASVGIDPYAGSAGREVPLPPTPPEPGPSDMDPSPGDPEPAEAEGGPGAPWEGARGSGRDLDQG